MSRVRVVVEVQRGGHGPSPDLLRQRDAAQRALDKMNAWLLQNPNDPRYWDVLMRAQDAEAALGRLNRQLRRY